MTVARCFPLNAPWLDVEPVGDVAVIAGIENRIRHYVVDGRPVATGLLPVGDAWACTNPSFGRGLSIGSGHAILLRDLLRAGSEDGPGQRSLRWADATSRLLEPWYRTTVDTDRQRLAEVGNDRNVVLTYRTTVIPISVAGGCATRS